MKASAKLHRLLTERGFEYRDRAYIGPSNHAPLLQTLTIHRVDAKRRQVELGIGYPWRQMLAMVSPREISVLRKSFRLGDVPARTDEDAISWIESEMGETFLHECEILLAILSDPKIVIPMVDYLSGAGEVPVDVPADLFVAEWLRVPSPGLAWSKACYLIAAGEYDEASRAMESAPGAMEGDFAQTVKNDIVRRSA